jgi:hypothetical protein
LFWSFSYLVCRCLPQLVLLRRCSEAFKELDPSGDAEQLAFELNAYLLQANAQFVVSQESTPINRTRRALDRRLTATAPA